MDAKNTTQVKAKAIVNKPIELNKVIDSTKIYSIDNYYDKYRVLQILNKENHQNLKINDVLFTKFASNQITIVGNQETNKYTGSVTIQFKVDRHIKYIVWIVITLIAFLVGMAVLLPIGLVQLESDVPHIGVVIASGVVMAISYISLVICLRVWPNELTKKQKAKLE